MWAVTHCYTVLSKKRGHINNWNGVCWISGWSTVFFAQLGNLVPCAIIGLFILNNVQSSFTALNLSTFIRIKQFIINPTICILGFNQLLKANFD